MVVTPGVRHRVGVAVLSSLSVAGRRASHSAMGRRHPHGALRATRAGMEWEGERASRTAEVVAITVAVVPKQLNESMLACMRKKQN